MVRIRNALTTGAEGSASLPVQLLDHLNERLVVFNSRDIKTLRVYRGK